MRHFLLALFLAASLPAWAQSGDVQLRIQFSRQLQACLDRAGGLIMPMADCHTRELALWDARLNRAYQAILTSDVAATSSKDRLREAQRAWIAYRDRGCQARAEVEAGGGSPSPLTSAFCRLEMTALRAHELEALQ